VNKLLADPRLLGAWAGMIGPALFVAVFSLEGMLRPGYDPLSTFISALALGSRGWIQILNFVVSGMLLLVFARGVRAEFPTGKASRAGPILLAISGICFIASGPLVMDPMYTPADQMTWHGIAHGIFGAIAFALAPITCLVFLRRFRIEPEWQPLRWWTLAAALILILSIVLLEIASPAPPATNALVPWAGLVQRTLVVTYLLWVFTFAFRLYRLSTVTDAPGVPA
jgi:hypothetical protein